MSSHEFFEIPVAEVTKETDDAISIALNIPPALAEIFQYRPGQFVTLRVPVEGKLRHRCYSLSSAPGIDPLHRIAVKRVDGGLVSNFLCGTVAKGDLLLVQPPAGLFVPPALDDDLTLIAGGSGITPILSILKSALAGGSNRITLIYANRDERSVIYAGEIRELEQDHGGRLVVHHWLESLQGLPASVHLSCLMARGTSEQIFICGPEKFMAAAVDAAHMAGFPSARIHVEKFISLPDEDQDSDQTAAIEAVDNNAEPAQLEVLLDGQTHHLTWSPGAKLLDVMLDAGLDAPYSCRVGGCSACMCRIVEGDVKMAKNLILTDDEMVEGWTLACQALPMSARISVDIP